MTLGSVYLLMYFEYTVWNSFQHNAVTQEKKESSCRLHPAASLGPFIPLYCYAPPVLSQPCTVTGEMS